MFFNKDKTSIEYTLTKSNRKTMSIIIENSGEVRVLAPKRLTNKSIHAFVMEKESWIREKQEVVHQKRRVKPRIGQGTELEILGEKYEVVFREVTLKKDEKIVLADRYLVYSYKPESKMHIAAVFENELKQLVTTIIEERIRFYSQVMGVYPKKVSVKDQKKRWGTCTSKGHVLFNWRLIFAPKSILDYVIIHELAHLKHMNHSADFWNLVSHFDQDYKLKREWLKQNGGFIDWSFETPDFEITTK